MTENLLKASFEATANTTNTTSNNTHIMNAHKIKFNAINYRSKMVFRNYLRKSWKILNVSKKYLCLPEKNLPRTSFACYRFKINIKDECRVSSLGVGVFEHA